MRKKFMNSLKNDGDRSLRWGLCRNESSTKSNTLCMTFLVKLTRNSQANMQKQAKAQADLDSGDMLFLVFSKSATMRWSQIYIFHFYIYYVGVRCGRHWPVISSI